MELRELVLRARSTRSFDPARIVTAAELGELIETVRFVPSAVNRQPLRYLPVTDPEKCDLILKNTSWGGLLPELSLPPAGHAPKAYIVICLDTSVSKEAGIDVGIAAQTLLLSAAERGLSGCMLGSMKKGLHDLLKLPEGLRIELVLALGKGDEAIVAEDAAGSTRYWRDAGGVHHVPKLTAADLIAGGKSE